MWASACGVGFVSKGVGSADCEQFGSLENGGRRKSPRTEDTWPAMPVEPRAVGGEFATKLARPLWWCVVQKRKSARKFNQDAKMEKLGFCTWYGRCAMSLLPFVYLHSYHRREWLVILKVSCSTQCRGGCECDVSARAGSRSTCCDPAMISKHAASRSTITNTRKAADQYINPEEGSLQLVHPESSKLKCRTFIYILPKRPTASRYLTSSWNTIRVLNVSRSPLLSKSWA